MSYKYNFDQSSDHSGKELFSMLKDVDVPEYVKTAELDDASELQKLPKTAFADSDRGIYPINTAARTYVSNAYFIDKKADIQKLYGEDYVNLLQGKIEKAAAIFNIEEDLAEYVASFNTKEASDYEEAYLTEFYVDGMSSPVQLYPIKTAMDLTESADHFVKNIANYPFDVRVKTAQNIVKAAAALDVEDIPELAMKYAGMYYPDLENLGDEVWRRSTKLKKEANVKMYDSLAKDLSNMASLSEVMKVAEFMFNVENMEGLYDNTKTAGLLGDPVDMIFTKQIEKVASDLDYVEVHGDKYQTSDLTKVSKDKYEEAFGFELDPSDIVKLADILPTMPRSDMALFREISGVRPI